jgi:hypothetical protein
MKFGLVDLMPYEQTSTPDENDADHCVHQSYNEACKKKRIERATTMWKIELTPRSKKKKLSTLLDAIHEPLDYKNM